MKSRLPKLIPISKLPIQPRRFFKKIIELSRKKGLKDPVDYLFRSLCNAGQSLILTRHRQNNDVLWTPGEVLQGWRDFFWPFAVDKNKLFVPPYKRHFRMTRYEVLQWNCAVVPIPLTGIPSLVKLMEADDPGVHAVVEAHDGVVVIFAVEAADFVTWTRECRRIKNMLASNRVKHGAFSLHNLAPISRNSKGHGAVLYLA